MSNVIHTTEKSEEEIEIELLLNKHRFYSMVIADILKAVQGKSYGGAFILAFCSIDYMGMAMKPYKAKNTPDDYKDFIKKYMVGINPIYDGLDDILYAIRCSLVHVYGESAATKDGDIIPKFNMNREIHLKREDNIIHLSLSNFVAEVIVAIEVFFREYDISLYSNNITIWGNKLYYPESINSEIEISKVIENRKIVFNNIHPFLSILDTNKLPKECYEDIRNKIELEISKVKN